MEVTVEQKLRALYKLQLIDSKIDNIKSLRGELPLEVSDLEDEIVGLETRFNNMASEIKQLEDNVSSNKLKIKESQALIKKYDGQLNNVKNNREYDALTKEIEIQGLEIQAAEKRIKDFQADVKYKNELLDSLKTQIDERKKDLSTKKSELDNIIEETDKEEKEYNKLRNSASKIVDERLYSAYHRIRDNVRNGLGVSIIERDSCSGCFASIPPQRQIEIKQHKKIIVCEHCGRILVDQNLAEEGNKEVSI